jgi:hypothetical protein
LSPGRGPLANLIYPRCMEHVKTPIRQPKLVSTRRVGYLALWRCPLVSYASSENGRVSRIHAKSQEATSPSLAPSLLPSPSTRTSGGYGLSKFITPWSMKDSFISDHAQHVSYLLSCSFGILFHFLGNRFRKWSRNSSVHDM